MAFQKEFECFLGREKSQRYTVCVGPFRRAPWLVFKSIENVKSSTNCEKFSVIAKNPTTSCIFRVNNIFRIMRTNICLAFMALFALVPFSGVNAQYSLTVESTSAAHVSGATIYRFYVNAMMQRTKCPLSSATTRPIW